MSERQKEDLWASVLFVLVVIALLAGAAGVISYQEGQEQVREEWCRSLNGELVGDLCVTNDGRVAWRWDG